MDDEVAMRCAARRAPAVNGRARRQEDDVTPGTRNGARERGLRAGVEQPEMGG